MQDSEARIRIEGGLANFPGLAREQAVSFDELEEGDRQEIARLAEEADFFGRSVPECSARPDARSYTISLTIGEQSRVMRVAEPIVNPGLAKLVSKVRRLCARRTAPPDDGAPEIHSSDD